MAHLTRMTPEHQRLASIVRSIPVPGRVDPRESRTSCARRPAGPQSMRARGRRAGRDGEPVAVAARANPPAETGTRFCKHLEALTDDFYHKLCFAHLQPVLDTLRWLKQQTEVWLEVTTLLIPGHNDGEDEIARLCAWVAEHLGEEVPLHFSAFYPAYKVMDVAPTPPDTIRRARQQALAAGLEHVYTGNIHDPDGQATHCAGCRTLLIGRDGYRITAFHLGAEGCCTACGKRLSGHFGPGPGDHRGRRELITLEDAPGR